MKLFRIFILALFSISLIACGGAEERKAVYMEKAKASIVAGDLDKARIELKNVLQIDPKNAEAYFQLGKVYEMLNDYRKAFANYKKAGELNPDHLATQARLGRIYLLLVGDVKTAQKKADFILSKEPANFDGLLLKAAILLKKNKVKESLLVAKNVADSSPDNVEATAFVVTLYLRENNVQDAKSFLQNALKINPDNVRLNKMLARILIVTKDYEEAELVLKKLLKINEDASENYNALASFYNRIGEKDKSEGILRESIKNDSDDEDRYLILAKYISEVRGEDAAVKELKKIISTKTNFGVIRLALGELLYSIGNKSSAIDVYNKAIADFPNELTGIGARTALAIIYLRDKDITKASEVVDEAIVASPNDPKINLLRARIALYEKDTEKAIIALRIVIKETPEDIDAYFLMAKAYQLENNKEQMQSTLNRAYENNKTDPDALLKLAKYYFSNNIKLSEKIIDDYNELKKSDYEGITLKTVILNKNKSYAEAYPLAQKLMKLYSNRPSGYVQAVPYLMSQGDKIKSISILEKGYINSKNDRTILVLLTTLQVSEKQFDVVVKRINAELRASPNDQSLMILLAKVYVAKNDISAAESLLNNIVENKSNIDEPYFLLAKIYQNKKAFKAVKSILEKGRLAVTSNLKISLELAAAYEFNKNYKKAIDLYRELSETYPENYIITNNLVSTISDFSSDSDDLELAKTLSEKLKGTSQPVFLDTVGWLYYKSGDLQNAIEYLKQATDKSPKVNVFNYHLGMAYKLSGDKEQAKIYLEKSMADGKNFKEKGQAKAALKNL